MKCPQCGCADDKVIDTRAAEDGKRIRRRRECLVCGTRCTTIERMEEMQLKQIDLVNEIGGKSRVSEILNKKRKLTVEMIRKLTTRLNLSPELLINDYQLTR